MILFISLINRTNSLTFMKADCNHVLRNLRSTRSMLIRAFIIFTMSFFSCLSSFGQAGGYPPFLINPDIEDTVKVSPCRLPYSIIKSIPATGDSIAWKVVKGNATFSAPYSFNTEVKDMKMDTCIISYSIYSSAKVLKITDSLVLINDKLTCAVINRTGITSSVTCGTPITLHSLVRTDFNYQLLWATDAGTTISNFTSPDPVLTFNTSGIHYVHVTARSFSGYNTLNDMITFNVTCPSTPVTKANAGTDIVLAACQFPIALNGNLPVAGETVKWEVISGTAFLQSYTSASTNLLDATNGTKLKYTISNGSSSSSDTLTVTVNPGTASVCDPVVSNMNPVCGDSIDITFGFGPTVAGFESYNFGWVFASELIPASRIPKNYSRVKVVSAGSHRIGISISSPYDLNSIARLIIINATCPATPVVTMANAGKDTTLLPCAFPFTLYGNTAKAGETVKWTLVSSSGMAVILNENASNAMLADATNGAKLVYTISNGSESSSDTMVVKINSDPTNSGCNPSVSDLAPACKDTVTIEFPWVTIPDYNYEWTLPSGVRQVFNAKNKIKVVIDDAGMKELITTFKTPYNFNTIVKRVLLDASCTSVSVTKANAGFDATAYCNKFQLAGNIPAIGETGKWRIIKGTAVIADEFSPTTYIYGFASDTLKFEWSISNTASQVSKDTVAVFVKTFKISGFTVTNASCGNNNGSAIVHMSGGLQPYKVFWQGGQAGSQLLNVPSGKYKVTVKDQSGCIVNDSVLINDNCTVATSYFLEGKVFAGNQLLTYGFAILMQNINGIPVPVKTTQVLNGYYRFTGVLKDEYVVYILPYKDREMTQLHDLYLPTFYVNKVSISSANKVNVIGNTYSVDIKLVSKKPAYFGPNTLTTDIRLSNYSIVPMLPVLLFNEKDSLVASGFYNGISVEFPNVASGNYYISVPVNGLGYKKSVFVSVNSDVTEDIDLMSNKLTGTMEEMILSSVNAYPNPFNDLLTIESGELEGNIVIRMLEGTTGREVKSITIDSADNYLLLTEDLPSGFYILQISNGNFIKNIPLIKK